MLILGRYAIDLKIPAATQERRAHGFGEEVCTLVVRPTGTEDATAGLCFVVEDILPVGDTLLALVLGDFRREPVAAIAGLAPFETDNGGPLYQVRDHNALHDLLTANIEQMVLVRGNMSQMREFEKAVRQPQPSWWKLSTKSAVGQLADLHDSLGHIVVYSASECSIELMGGERAVVQAMEKLLHT